MKDLIGKTVEWNNAGHYTKTGLVIAEVPVLKDVREVIRAAGMETTPIRTHQWRDALMGARYKEIGSIRSTNPRCLVLVNGRHLYAPRQSDIRKGRVIE